MAFANIWLPDPAAVTGLLIEIPIRAPDLPANLWVHWSAVSANWAGFPPNIKNGDWHDAAGALSIPVAVGDTVLAGQASVGLAAAHREEQGLFDTDDWGMAIDAVGQLATRVEGPGNVILPVSMRTLGNCWPVGLNLSIDLLVLRTSLIPTTPAPYGQRPKRESWRDMIVQRIDEVKSFADRKKVLKQLLEEMDSSAEAADEESRQASRPIELPRRATVGLSVSLTTPITPTWRPPAPTLEKTSPPERTSRTRGKARS